MQSIGLVLCLHNTQPPGTSGHDLRRAFERAYLPMLDALTEYPGIKASMHWSGALLEWMELHAPTELDRLIALALSGRVEILGGLFGAGVIPSLPERDIVGQVGMMTRWWRAHGDIRVRGAWLPYSAWDPSAARILGRLGLQFSVLEENQFFPPVTPDGYYLTEREGTALALFAADTRLARLVPDASPGRILKAIALRARDGARCLVLALPGEGFGAALDSSATHCFGTNRGWVRRFFAALSDNAHWIKLVSFGTVIDRMRPTDRAYPPASVTAPVSMAALGGARATQLRRLLLESRRDWSIERAAPFLRGAPWDHLLSHYPEINRLHKRMLRTSAEVARLRASLRDDRREGDGRAEALEEATRALYRGQSGAAYVLGAEIGAQDAGVRAQAYASLLRAEYVAASALGEIGRTRVEQVDYDCDGRAEVIVRTPQLCAIVAPSSGGTLVELDAWSLPGNLLNVRTRRDEPEHEDLRKAENLPTVITDVAPETTVEIEEEEEDAGEEDTDVTAVPPVRVEEGLAGRLQYDRHVRSSFIDHFLGPEATLHNVRMSRFPEVGDFVGADYQLLKVEETDAGDTFVGVARDGNVNEGAALRLVRIQKRFAFSRDLAGFDVRYEIANRYHEPVRSRFAVELNLGLDGSFGPGVFLEPSADLRVPLTEAGDHPDVASLALVDEDRGFRLLLSFQAPAHIWHFPIETISRTPHGIGRCFQGICLLAWWPIELWGQERRRIDIAVSLEC